MQADREDPTTSLSAWRAEVAKVLQKMGKLAPDESRPDPEKLIAWTTYDDLEVSALYTADGARAAAPAARDAALGWDVRVLVESLDAAEPARAALVDLENGASSLWLRMGVGGLPLGSLGAVLGEVLLDLAPVALDAGAETVAAAKELFAVHAARGVDLAAVRGTLGADPWGHRARTGAALDSAGMVDLVALAKDVSARYRGLATFTVDATAYHDAGATDAQELGYALSVGVDYLRQLTKAGLTASAAASQLEFRYAATADQFATIAKFRAARVAWARVLEVCGIDGAARQVQHAVTSRAMMTQRDPWVNMLRTTIAGFAAGVGGATSVTVLPFDSALGVSDAFARRMARNTQSLLLEEANVGRVADPAGGSFYVEALTQELAKAAWRVFQEIEGAGGWKSAWESGLVRTSIATRRTKREKNIARRKDAITGVSEFPSLHEKPVARAPRAAIAANPDALPEARYAAAFEKLRDRSDAALHACGARPSIFLATLGTVAAHTARATFISNLLQAGGIEPWLSSPLHSEADLDASLAGTEAPRIACLCGTDAAYKDHATWVVPLLRARGVSHVILAGKLAALDGTNVAVDESIAAGCDALSVLTSLLARLEVP